MAPLVLEILIAFHLQRFAAYITPSGVTDGEEFDFIVVGAGSAGSVLAGRLVESGHSVLLVEAGGPANFLQSFPATFMFFALLDSGYVWPYFTVGQKHVGSYTDDRIQVFHGKSLGGTGSLNAMVYVRGSPDDFDKWESVGNPGWGWEQVLSYFKKAERFHGDNEGIDIKQHGKEGRWWVMQKPEDSMTLLDSLLSKAAQEMGYKVGDPHSSALHRDEVAFRLQSNLRHGLRADTFTSYVVEPGHMHRSDGRLKVLTYAEVTRLLLEDGRAKGVSVTRFGKELALYARKEVILSAGAIGSPKVLMLSGIGPEDHLKQVGVKAVVDVPGVGANLQDHVVYTYPIYTNDSKARLGPGCLMLANPYEYVKYYLTRGGMMGSIGSGFLMLLSTVQGKAGKRRGARRDISVFTVPFFINSNYGAGVENVYRITRRTYEAITKEVEDKYAAMIFTALLHPKSRGTIRLNSSNPFGLPLIDPNYLDHPDDMKTLKAGIQLVSKIAGTSAFKEHGLAPLPNTHFCGHLEPLSEMYYECSMKHGNSVSMFHFAGTCKMGPDSDRMAVVDPELRVRGVSRLRVVDASVMPTIVGGNPQAAVVMIAEKAADMINADWPVKPLEGMQKEEL